MATKEESEKLKILEQRIKELEARTALYERILACLPLGIQVFDEKGFSFFINAKQRELLGLPDLTTCGTTRGGYLG